MKNIGTISWGVKAPIIRPGDDLVEITADSVMKAVKEAKIKLKDRDIVAVTEAIVAKVKAISPLLTILQKMSEQNGRRHHWCY